MSALLCQFCRGSGLDSLGFDDCEACDGTGFRENIDDWWRRNLSEYVKDGRRDANKGEFSPPHQVADDDPQYMDENQAYKEGFMQRRRELGDKFKWA